MLTSVRLFYVQQQHPKGPPADVTDRHPWHEVEQDVKRAIEKAHDLQCNRRRQPHSLQVGNSVLLERDGISFPAEVKRSRRLLSPWLGPFTISKIDEQNVTLELPPNLRIYNVFSVSKVKPYLSRPESQIPVPDYIDGAPEYEVERILGQRNWRRHVQ